MAEDTDPKIVSIEIEVYSGGTYAVSVSSDTVEEEVFEADSLAGVRSRLDAIVENLSQYLPTEESKDGEGADPSPRPEADKKEEEKP